MSDCNHAFKSITHKFGFNNSPSDFFICLNCGELAEIDMDGNIIITKGFGKRTLYLIGSVKTK